MSVNEPVIPPSSPVPGRDAGAGLSRRVAFAGAAAGVLGAVELARSGTAEAAPAQNWSTVGNVITSTDYLGATSVQPLIFKTSATANTPVERMRIAATGGVAINSTSTAANLTIVTTSSSNKIGLRVANHTSNGSGAAVYVNSDAAPGISVVNTKGNALVVTQNATDATGSGITVQTTTAPAINVSSTSNDAINATSTNHVGINASGQWLGVFGIAGGQDSTGVQGTSNGEYGVGAYGYASGASSYGVNGQADCVVDATGRPSIGVFGSARDTTVSYGVYGSGGRYAIYANGDAHVTGTLSKAAGSFKIDHPLDPERKWLSHSFVESPDMMNVYNGNATLDANGTATVVLPDYFESLNRDFRYQLTCIGGAALVYIASEITGGKFTIAGGTKGLKVSWQVTGVRQDDYAKAHPIVVEQAKAGREDGTRQFVPGGSKATKFNPTGDRKAPRRPTPTRPSVVQPLDVPVV